MLILHSTFVRRRFTFNVKLLVTSCTKWSACVRKRNKKINFHYKVTTFPHIPTWSLFPSLSLSICPLPHKTQQIYSNLYNTRTNNN